MLFLLSSVALAATPPDALLASIEDHLNHGEGCLTPLVNELRQRADELTPAQRATATRLLTPWKSDFLAPVAPLRTSPPPPDAIATEPCFSLGENRITSEHFAVEWDTGVITEGTAQKFLDALEEGYDVQVGQLGWKEPLQADNYLLLAYVEEGNYQGAFTTVEYCGGGLAPYINAYAGSFSSSSWADTMAVHELNHALQFSYGYAWEFWWWEATATYIESQVYPSSNWWAYYVTGYADSPHLAFNASDQRDQEIFWHMYGMAIWGAYMDEYIGGPDAVLATWEASDGERGMYEFGMRDAFEELGYDFDAAYADFIAKNAVMQYEAQRFLPVVDEGRSIGSLPASEEAEGSKRPQGYGQNYVRIEAGAGEGDLVVTFEGESDVPWSVQLVEVDDEEILRVVAADVVDGVGTVTLPGYGNDDVVLVVSPLVDSDDKHDYSWSADVLAPAEDLTLDGEEKNLACGCASGTGGSVGIGALLGLAALVRRRR